MSILLTGYTGNIGYAVAKHLHSRRIAAVVRDPSAAPELPNVRVYPGDLAHLPRVAQDTEVIIHCAARTGFRASLNELREDNVDGTGRLLEFARTCPGLRRFVFVSTTCVSGTMQGVIPESRLTRPEGFVNPYEQSKWEAEELVFDSGLQADVIRLSIVAGSGCDGSVRRPGAIQHMLYWLWKGLIPMIPASPGAVVDIIDTEYAVSVIAACVDRASGPCRVVHAGAGEEAPSPREMLDAIAAVFAESATAWRTGSITPPCIVDAETYRLFERSVMQSGDALFRRVLSDAGSFLPALLFERRNAIANARSLCPARPERWKSLARKICRHVTHPES